MPFARFTNVAGHLWAGRANFVRPTLLSPAIVDSAGLCHHHKVQRASCCGGLVAAMEVQYCPRVQKLELARNTWLMRTHAADIKKIVLRVFRLTLPLH